MKLNLQQVSLQVKIVGGFVFIAVICFLVGIIGWGGSNKLRHMLEETGLVQMPILQTMLTLEEYHMTVRVSQSALLNPALALAERQRQHEIITRSLNDADQAFARLDTLLQGSDERRLLAEFQAGWRAWQDEMEAFLVQSREVNALHIYNPQRLALEAEKAFGTYKWWAAETSKAILERTEQRVAKPEELAFWAWLQGVETENSQIMAARDRIIQQLTGVLRSVRSLMDFISISEYTLAQDVYVGEVLPSIEGIQLYLDDLMEPISLALALYTEMARIDREQVAGALENLEQRHQAMIAATDRSVNQTIDQGVALSGYVSAVLIVVVLLATTVAVGLGFLLSRIIVRPVSRAVSGLSDNATQVRNASVEIMSASHILSQGASEQAAAHEQTAASLQELAAMVKEDTSRLGIVDDTARQTGEVVEEANRLMGQLTSTMDEISEASTATSKIVKSIDEIAFQTNLLALNAAVEAARAGEAGAGFAVVADEVRNLAMRAADAARNTAQLIEKTVLKVQKGSEINAQTSASFARGAESIRQISSLISEVVQSIESQAAAVSEIEKAGLHSSEVTQKAAATSEELAAAADEFSGQVAVLDDLVHDLDEIVTGRRQESPTMQAVAYHPG